MNARCGSGYPPGRRAAVHPGPVVITQAFLDRTGRPRDELEARYRQKSLDQVRAHLDQEQYDRARATGMALSSDKALDLASRKTLPA
jgi:hypothetical protein